MARPHLELPAASTRSSSGRIAFALALLLGFPLDADAADFAVARRTDDEIREFVTQALAPTAELDTNERRGTLILANVVLLRCGRYQTERTENRTFHIYDETQLEVATQIVQVREPEIRVARAWRMRPDGHVDRIGDDDVEIRRDEITGVATIEFRIADLRAGDTFGWSVATHENEGIVVRREPLRFSQRLLRGRLYVLTERTLTYRLDLRNIDVKELEFDRSRAPTRQQIDFRDQPPETRDMLMLPWVSREPHVTVSRASRNFKNLWVLRDDWDHWVASDWGNPRRWLAKDERLTRMAERITEGWEGDEQRADALYRYVRDEIGDDPHGDLRRELGLTRLVAYVGPLDLSIPMRTPEEPRPMRERLNRKTLDGRLFFEEIPGRVLHGRQPEPQRSPTEVLDEGRGTAFEKTVLFGSLLAAVHVPNRIGLVRDRSLGLPDQSAPGSWHFSDLVVLMLTADGRPGRWYCLTRGPLPAGSVPVDLQGASALFVADDLQQQLDAAWERASMTSRGREVTFAKDYDIAIRDLRLALRVKIPELGEPPCARVTETIRRSTDSLRASAEVSWTGSFDALWPNLGAMTEDGGIERYWRSRLPGAHAERFAAPTVSTDLDTTRTEVRGELELPPLPPATAEQWQLDAALVFGSSPLDRWQGDERSTVHVAGTQEYHWIVELPLPEGWATIFPPTSLRIRDERLSYDAAATVEGRRIRIERLLRLHAGTSGASSIPSLDRAIHTIRDYESRPQIFTRLESRL